MAALRRLPRRCGSGGGRAWPLPLRPPAWPTAAERATGSRCAAAVPAPPASVRPAFVDDPARRPTLRMTARHAKERGGDTRVSKGVPWIFRDEVDNFAELAGIAAGRTELLVNVESSEGRELGVAACTFRKGVHLCARVLSTNITVPVDQAFFEERVRLALVHREHFFPGRTDYRLLNAEGDMVPGVVCDRYGDVLCLQFSSAAVEGLFTGHVLDALQEVCAPQAIVRRCDLRADRGLEVAEMYPPAVLRGHYAGPTCIEDADMTAQFDLLDEAWVSGRFFEDRPLRPLLARELATLAAGKSRPTVLGISTESLGALAVRSGAHVTLGLASAPSGDGAHAVLPRAHLERLVGGGEVARSTSFMELPEEPNPQLFALSGTEGFDVVLLEPPPLAPTYGRVEEGSRLYTAWLTAAVAATKPGGWLLMSCRSRTMSSVRLLRCVNLALWAQGREAQVLYRTAAAPGDFPMHMGLLDSGQLQSLVLRVS